MRDETVCRRCGATIATDSKGAWANVETLSYRCIFVGDKHEPVDEEANNEGEKQWTRNTLEEL